MTMVRSITVSLAALLLSIGPAFGGEGGTVLKADELRAEPFRDARRVGSLTTGDKVEILDRQGVNLEVAAQPGIVVRHIAMPSDSVLGGGAIDARDLGRRERWEGFLDALADKTLVRHAENALRGGVSAQEA